MWEDNVGWNEVGLADGTKIAEGKGAILVWRRESAPDTVTM